MLRTCRHKIIVKQVAANEKKPQKICWKVVLKTDPNGSKLLENAVLVPSAEIPIGVELVHNVVSLMDADQVIDIDELDTKTLRSPVMVLSLLLKSPIYNLINDIDKELIHAIREDRETL